MKIRRFLNGIKTSISISLCNVNSIIDNIYIFENIRYLGKLYSTYWQVMTNLSFDLFRVTKS